MGSLGAEPEGMRAILNSLDVGKAVVATSPAALAE
jgi:hypothetical protein